VKPTATETVTVRDRNSASGASLRRPPLGCHQHGQGRGPRRQHRHHAGGAEPGDAAVDQPVGDRASASTAAACPAQSNSAARRAEGATRASSTSAADGHLDILAVNQLANALFSPLFDSPARPANPARFLFLDPRAAEFYPDWEPWPATRSRC
jgi:MmyB-like transcription regulator ligand binding domain